MPRKDLALLVLALVVLRALVVLALPDVFGFGEEFAKGTAAKAMLDGLGIEHWKLNYVYHEGGGFTVTHLNALAFLVVGESVLAHKLVALAITACILAVGCTFVAENFGRLAAWIFGGLFVLCPASYQRLSLLNLGTHFEALLFISLALLFTARIVFGGSTRLRDHALLGLASGFGIYFSLQCVPVVAWCGLWILIARRGRIFTREIGVALVGFVVGLLPLAWMWTKIGRGVVEVRGKNLVESRWDAVGAAFEGLFVPLRADGSALDWVVVGAFVLATIVGLALHLRPQSPRRLARYAFVFGYLVLFLGIFLSRAGEYKGVAHWFAYCRLSPMWYFATLLVAATCAAGLALENRIAARVAGGFTAFLLAAGAADVLGLVLEGRPGSPIENAMLIAKTKGYQYSEYFDKLLLNLEGPWPDRLRVLARFDDVDPAHLYSAISFSGFEKSTEPLESVLATCEAVYGEHYEAGLLGLGHFVHARPGYGVRQAFQAIEDAPAEVRPILAEAIGRAGLGPRFRAVTIARQLTLDVPEQYRERYLRGSGFRVYHAFRFDPDGALEFIAEQKGAQREALRAGYERARADDTLAD